MSRRRWRLRTLLAGTLATGAALSLAIAGWSASRALTASLDGVLPAAEAARVAAEVRVTYVVATVLLVLGIAVLGLTLGSALAARVERLRSGVLANARVTSAGPRLARSQVAEIDALASAVELLVGEFAERAATLARDREELALLVNAVSEGILQIDAGARVVRANPAARTLLRLPPDPRGQPVDTLVRNAELRTLLGASARGEAIPAGEVDVEGRRLLVVSRPFTEGDAPGAVIAFIDLTELRRLEGVRRDFVANVSHELKTPLTSIRGYVETLLSDDLPAEMQRQFLDVVHANAERLHRIVEDLLDLSRLESGGWRPEIRDVDPLAIARDAWLGAAPAADAKSLTFNALGDSISALADPAGLRQVLVNLYDNAIRHTPAGGTVTVRVRRGAAAFDAAQRGEWAVIEVQDTGTGIPGDALGRVFERFYRVDPARSRAEGGTGLGLSIVKHLVERMGGDVAAESELGKGTLVRVRLPLASPTGLTAEHSAA